MTILSGTLLEEAVRRAAGRGVRVPDFASMISIPPAMTRCWLRAGCASQHRSPLVQSLQASPLARAEFSSPISRASNRRMHNKSFTADNQATIVGGRNVGDEYFGASQDLSVRRPRRAGHRADRARSLGGF